MKYSCIIVILTLMVESMAIYCPAFSADNDQKIPDQRYKIKTSDFMGKASDGYIKPQVIGELGYPLGKLLTISGYWRQSEWMPEGIKFHVVSVNGRGVGNRGVVFDKSCIKPDGRVIANKVSCKEWDMWELRGYESGAFKGIPGEIFEEMNSIIVPGSGFKYQKEFVYFRLEKTSLPLPQHLEVLKDVELSEEKESKSKHAARIELTRYLNSAITWRQKGHHREALVILNKAVEKYPKVALTYASRGILHFCTQDHKKAVADYNEAIKIDPKCVLAHLGLGGVCLFEKDYEKAISHLTRVIELEPLDGNAYFVRGAAHFKAKRLDQAIADLNQAIHLESDSRQPYGFRGIEPVLGNAYLLRSIVLLNLSTTNAAFTDLDASFDMNRTRADAYWIRSFVHEKTGKQGKSDRDRKEAIRIAPYYRDAKNIYDGIIILGRRWGRK